MQLHSKMRYIAVQFDRYLYEDLWQKHASHANNMAKAMADQLRKIPQLKITQDVCGNGIFVILPASLIPQLQKEYFFHVWNEATNEVRLMCSWDTTEEDITGFVALLNGLLD